MDVSGTTNVFVEIIIILQMFSLKARPNMGMVISSREANLVVVITDRQVRRNGVTIQKKSAGQLITNGALKGITVCNVRKNGVGRRMHGCRI